MGEWPYSHHGLNSTAVDQVCKSRKCTTLMGSCISAGVVDCSGRGHGFNVGLASFCASTPQPNMISVYDFCATALVTSTFLHVLERPQIPFPEYMICLWQ